MLSIFNGTCIIITITTTSIIHPFSIPKHCFKHSYVTSFSYLLSDLMMIACFFYLAYYCDKVLDSSSSSSSSSIPPYFKYLLWPIYWYAQGSVMTGIWVIGKFQSVVYYRNMLLY